MKKIGYVCLIITLITCIILDICMIIDGINNRDFGKAGLLVVASFLCVPGLVGSIENLIKEYKTK